MSSALRSIPVGDVSVVYSVPAIYCNTARYSRWLVLAVIFLLGDTIGFPLGLGVFLTIRHRKLFSGKTIPTDDNSSIDPRPKSVASSPMEFDERKRALSTLSMVSQANLLSPQAASFLNRYG